MLPTLFNVIAGLSAVVVMLFSWAVLSHCHPAERSWRAALGGTLFGVSVLALLKVFSSDGADLVHVASLLLNASACLAIVFLGRDRRDAVLTDMGVLDGPLRHK